MFSPSSRARLTDRDLGRFPGGTLFDRLARAVCQAGCLPRKELYEAWEVARRVRRLFRGGRVIDLAAGHGLLAQAMLLLDDSSSTAVAIDRTFPASSARLHDMLVRTWPRLSGRIAFVARALEDVEILRSDLVVSSHACGVLTDLVLDRAAAARARVAVLPCCHDLAVCDAGPLTGWVDGPVAVDIVRAMRLEQQGYRVWTQTIPAEITPQNRLLIGAPDAPSRLPARRRVSMVYNNPHPARATGTRLLDSTRPNRSRGRHAQGAAEMRFVAASSLGRRFSGAMCLCLSMMLLIVVVEGGAQQRAADPSDPRIGLKAGLRDAGEAAKNMERIASLSKPEGFFDPKSPGGPPIPPERDPNLPPLPPPDPASPAGQAQANMLGFANSDLAFSGNHVFMGSFHGFTTYDVERPSKPKLSASVVCPGGQGDISVHGHLLFMSVEQTRGRLDCGTQGVQTTVSAERFRGVRIFDITDLSKPKQVAAVQTCRGSHTHTIVPDPNDPTVLYVYGSGTAGVRSGDELTGCSDRDPKEDPNTALFSIDVIQVPLAAPQNAKIVNRPRIFADPVTGAIAGLSKGGDIGPGGQKTRETNQCHDVTVFPEVGLAAGACSGNGVLLDIRDPKNPVRLDSAADTNFAYWHSATFNGDGTKVIFTDEWGGGGRPRCRASDPLNWGADAIFDIVNRKLVFKGYYKMPAPQTETENCVAHNGSLIPVPGRDIMVQAWYQGGVSVFDFTDSATPVEIAFFDRGPIDAKNLILGGFWSAYWYNGQIYGSEIVRGIDVFKLKPSEYLSQNELDAANMVRSEEVNTQEQTRFVWPASFVVARAYVDQLTRSKGILPARANAVKAALDRADSIRTGKERNAAAVLDQLDALAAQLEGDAGGAGARDAMRLRSLAATIKGRTAKLRG